MTIASWEELLEVARQAYAAPSFDVDERDYKLQIASALRDVMAVARDGGDWPTSLDRVFTMRLDDGGHYNLTNWRQNQWLQGVIRSEHDAVRGAVAGFLDADVEALGRFSRLAAVVEGAVDRDEIPRADANVLAFGSLFNMAVQPDALPLVRARVFERLEAALGVDARSGSLPERYSRHLAFAREARARMETAGIPIRDMLDVQGLLWIASNRPDNREDAEQVVAALDDGAATTRGQTRRVWWVCQGLTYRSARDLGLLWAPKTARDGSGRSFWRALEEARPGDLVLHYADSNVRAVSTIAEAAVDAPRPPELAGDWVEGDGWLVRTDYHELDEPLVLSAIPEAWRISEGGPFTQHGSVQQGYFFSLSDRFVNELARRLPQLGLGTPSSSGERTRTAYMEPAFSEIQAQIATEGLRLSERTLRRYHVALKTRGFVILAGVSGSGKTWLAEAYADAVGARRLVVPVAPNWTTNEDLLGYRNPIDDGYRHTAFSLFLQRAAAAYADAHADGQGARPFHLILDELNLARVEYYFAKFLSAMEARSRYGTAPLVLADELEVPLTPNLKFIGTVNVDETTYGFADKVYDRAQLLELDAQRDDLAAALGEVPERDIVLDVWDAVVDISPFAFRVVEDIKRYVREATQLGAPWEEALDEQFLQKILPKLKGSDPRLRDALERVVTLTREEFPLTCAKAESMLAAYTAHGFASYF